MFNFSITGGACYPFTVRAAMGYLAFFVVLTILGVPEFGYWVRPSIP